MVPHEFTGFTDDREATLLPPSQADQRQAIRTAIERDLELLEEIGALMTAALKSFDTFKSDFRALAELLAIEVRVQEVMSPIVVGLPHEGSELLVLRARLHACLAAVADAQTEPASAADIEREPK